jgi:hypothetical protein
MEEGTPGIRHIDVYDWTAQTKATGGQGVLAYRFGTDWRNMSKRRIPTWLLLILVSAGLLVVAIPGFGCS